MTLFHHQPAKSESYKRLSRRVHHFARARGRLENRRTVYHRAFKVGALSTAGLLLLSGWVPNGLLNLFLAVALVVAVLRELILAWRSRHRRGSDIYEAHLMERLAGGLQSRLICSLDFAGRPDPTPLQQHVIDQACEDLSRNFEGFLDGTVHHVWRKRFIIVMGVLLAVQFSPWFGLSQTAHNLTQSWASAIEMLFPVHLEVIPAGRTVHEVGDSVPVQLFMSPRRFDRVTLERTVTEGSAGTSSEVSPSTPETEDLLLDAEGRASFELTHDEPAIYEIRFSYGTRRTEPLQVVFTERPVLVNMQSELIFPAYTRTLPITLEGYQPELRALVNTRVGLGFTFSKPLTEASILWADGQELPLETLDRFATIVINHEETRSGVLQVTDVDGMQLETPLDLSFLAERDQAPTIELPRMLERDMPLTAEAAASFGFGAWANDDYGVRRFLLEWRKARVDAQDQVLERGEVERVLDPPLKRGRAEFMSIFSHVPLQPGETIIMRVTASDIREPQAQSVRSREFSFFVQGTIGGQAGGSDALLAARALQLSRTRIQRAPRTSVKDPQDLRNINERVNTHDEPNNSKAIAPLISGEHRAATADYFRLLNRLNPTETESSADGDQPPGINIPGAGPER